MSFLNPAFLWFALGVIVPILVHLFNFRKPKKILFSNIAFVKQVHKEVVRRVKLKQWLLLFARMLAIIALAVAFANPIITDEKAAAVSAESQSAVIVIDNSYSMTASDGEGVYLQQALDYAHAIVNSFSATDEFQIQPTSSLRLNSGFLSKQQAGPVIDKIKYQDKVVGYGEIINNLEYYFTEAQNASKRLYFISDFQKSTTLSDTLKNLRIPDDVQVQFIPVGEQEQNNVFVSNVNMEQAILEIGKPVALNLTLNNDSDKEIEELSINVEAEDKAVAISSANLKANESAVKQVTFTPNQGGWQKGKISIDDAPIDFDNTRYFSYYIPDNSKLLIITGDETSAYLNLLYKNLVSQYDVNFVEQRAMASVDLTEYAVVIMAGVNETSSGVVEQLNKWVRNGGGLMFFPSENMNTASVNQLYAQLGLGAFGKLTTYEKPMEVRQPDLSHVLFETVFQKTKKGAQFDGPAINRIFEFLPNEQAVQTTIIQDKNGKPFLHEGQVDGGRVYTFGVFPSLKWSDFPIKGAFVPVLVRATLILNNTARAEFSQEIGDFRLRTIQTSSKELVKLRREDGYEVIPEQYPQAGVVALKFDRADIKAGNYGVYQNDSLLERISFNYPDDESAMQCADAEELADFLQEKNLDNIEINDRTIAQYQNDVATTRQGVPLWKYFLMFACLMLVGEILILKFLK